MFVDTQRADELSDGRAAIRIVAGERADDDVACAHCGYGVGPRTILPACPMCHGVAWEPRRHGRPAAGRHSAR